MDKIQDFIVVGSGPSGSMAAFTLLEEGANVEMIDGGYFDDSYEKTIPDLSYSELRYKDDQQFKYLLGNNYEGIDFSETATGAQLTPSRKYITADVETHIPVKSNTFFPMASLALGGLGSGWGAGCYVFSENEMALAGLDYKDMLASYNVISRRIHISGTRDDCEKYTIRGLQNVLPSTYTNINGQKILARYSKHKKRLNKQGFTLGKPGLAVLTKDIGERKSTDYRDMEFYSDKHKSIWRPWMTVKDMKKNNKFKYSANIQLLYFKEKEGIIELTYRHIGKGNIFFKKYCHKLILACGAFNTARVVLSSNNDYSTTLPMLCNPYYYTVCIQPTLIGNNLDKKSSLAQLSLFYDANGKNEDVSMASLYSYGSLMMFRVLKELPLNYRDSRKIFRYLLPSLLIAGIHHPDSITKYKHIQLTKSYLNQTGICLNAEYKLSEEEQKKIFYRNTKFNKALRKLGCIPVKLINPGYGSSIHYAGTLPFSDNPETYHLHDSGLLYHTKSVYVADSSGFKYLPAKGITLSIMANAHLVAKNALI